MKKKWYVFVAVLLMLCMVSMPATAFAKKQTNEYNKISFAFSGGISSQVEAHDENGSTRGGYALMRGALLSYDADYEDDLFLLSPGNFARPEGLYKHVYADSAGDLLLMSRLGFDVTGLGGGELSLGEKTFEDMYDTASKKAKKMDLRLPRIVCSNLDYDKLGKKQTLSKKIRRFTILKNDDNKVAVMGIMEPDQLPKDSKLKAIDPWKAVKAAVRDINDYAPDADMIVCLCSGMSLKQCRRIAAKSKSIDLMICDFPEVTREQITVRGTTILSAGEGSDRIGELVMVKNSYQNYHVDEFDMQILKASRYDASPRIARAVSEYGNAIDDWYFGKLGYEHDRYLGKNQVNFKESFKTLADQEENIYGDFLADAYRAGYFAQAGSSEKAAGKKTEEKKSEKTNKEKSEGSKESGSDNTAFAEDLPVVGVVSANAVSKAIPKGKLTPAKLFDLNGMKEGDDGLIGSGMVSFIVDGKSLKAIVEADVSLKNKEPEHRYHFSGLKFEYSKKRFKYNKTFNVQVLKNDGSYDGSDGSDGSEGSSEGSAEGSAENSFVHVKDKDHYRMITDDYTFNYCLQRIVSESNGMLQFEPYADDGSLALDQEDVALKNGKYDYKQWETAADYLKLNDEVISKEKYSDIAAADSEDSARAGLAPRKVVNNDVSRFYQMSRAAKLKLFMYMLPVLILLLILIIVLIVKAHRRRSMWFKADKPRRQSFTSRRRRNSSYMSSRKYKKTKKRKNRKLFK